MKKLFLALAVIGFSGFAFAYPAIGDSVTYNMVSTANGATSTGTLSMKVMGLDTKTGKWIVGTLVVSNGQPTGNTIETDLLNRDQVTAALGDCVNAGGSPEQIVVPAGAFQTCKIPVDGGGAMWIADVPFGIAKFEQGSVTMELASYIGKK